MWKEIFYLLLRRAVLVLAGTSFIVKYLGPDGVEKITGDSFIMELGAALTTLGLLVWSVLRKKVDQERLPVAIAAPATTSVKTIENKVSVKRKIRGAVWKVIGWMS